MTSCTYTFDSEDWQEKHGVDINEHWTWDCPHERHGDKNEHCIFHLSGDERDAAGIDDDKFRERFVEKILRGEENRLHGAVLGNLSLDFLSLRDTADEPINLRANEFEQLSFANAQVRSAILLDYSRLTELDVSHAVFDHALALQRATVDGNFSAVMADLDRVYGEGLRVGKVDFAEAEIKRAGFHGAHIDTWNCTNADLSVILREATFHEEFTVGNAKFKKLVDAKEATFKCPCTINEVEFTDRLLFEKSTFEADVEIEDTELQGVGFTRADVAENLRIADCLMDNLVLDAATIDGELSIRGTFEERLRASKTTCNKVRMDGVTSESIEFFDIDAGEVYISDAQVDEFSVMSCDLPDMHIYSSEFDSIGITNSVIDELYVSASQVDSLNLIEATVNGDHQRVEVGEATFINSIVEDISWRGDPVDQYANVSFIGGSIKNGSLYQPVDGRFRFIFNGSTLGNVRPESPDGGDLEQIYFVATDFDEFPFEDYTDELAPEWQLNVEPEFEDTDFDAGPLEAYQTYQSARASAEASIQEDARAGLYNREMQYRGAILRKRWNENLHWGSLAKWFELRLLDWICGYGEDPGRPILVSFAVITVFAFMYMVMLNGTGADGGNFLTAITLSMQAFATLVFGASDTFSGVLGRFLTSLEGVIGTFLIPFLVFSLTKSID